MDGIIPDVVMQVKDRTLLVEILVTHPVTVAKRHWLKENGLPMIEFNFSATDRTVEKADLQSAFLQPQRPYGNGSCRWIHHPAAHEKQERLNSEFRAKYIDRFDELMNSTAPASQATCEHEQIVVVGDDGVQRSVCSKCRKFFGRVHA